MSIQLNRRFLSFEPPPESLKKVESGTMGFVKSSGEPTGQSITYYGHERPGTILPRGMGGLSLS
jgi:hypothetical protein